MSDDESAVHRERLKSALWYTIGKAVDNVGVELDVNATPQFIGALTEMVFSQVELVAKDLESFANHAGRTTVSTDDVLLLTRRNQALGEIIKEKVEEEARKRGDKEKPVKKKK
ncbi:kinetochore component CENP-S-domain-containing protein [Pyronema domesticum]|uniref:Similar to Centromere protein S acc. no. Q9D084 n=1 Tax=Pyronema omphalodes (strain CBS 100304) TaxID=1076935 RepID=U4L4Z1_PYROM|nr:kinetochore component CENP-S-domain-containing protein [Pyronema domesticum]CCX07368.1 Similar to Centromere protein S; acc. no. Q9D084 [Pyronema omphalodes CBS 100304]